jgi:multiple antibiotic resistance protein
VTDGLLEPGAWRRFLFVPVTFPLTVGGTTFAFFVGFRAEATSALEVVALSVAGVAYAALTGATVYASARLHRRTSPAAQAFLERIAGILLTAIAVTILASGVTRLVVDVLAGLNR